MKLCSDFAMIDIKRGRGQLKKIFKQQNGYSENGERVPVTIHGYITNRHSGDDGTSMEFGVDVREVIAGDVEATPRGDYE